MWPEFVDYIGTRFTAEQYLFWSRIEGTLWTAADVAIAFLLIRMGNLVRGVAGRRRHRVSYLVLLATLPAAGCIPIVQSADTFFRLELAVTIPHFLIILYVCAADARTGLRALHIALSAGEQRAEPAGVRHETTQTGTE